MGEIYISLLAMQISIAHLRYSQRDKKNLASWRIDSRETSRSIYLLSYFTKIMIKNLSKIFSRHFQWSSCSPGRAGGADSESERETSERKG